MIVDFRKEAPWAEKLEMQASVSKGELKGLALRELPGGNMRRVSFEFEPGDNELLELQLTLTGPEGPESETWLYRWTPT